MIDKEDSAIFRNVIRSVEVMEIEVVATFCYFRHNNMTNHELHTFNGHIIQALFQNEDFFLLRLLSPYTKWWV